MKNITKLIMLLIAGAICMTTSAAKASEDTTKSRNPVSDGTVVEPAGYDVTIKLKDGNYLTLDKAYADDLKVNNDIGNKPFVSAFPFYYKTIKVLRPSPSFAETLVYKEYTSDKCYSGSLIFNSSYVEGENKYVGVYGGFLFVK